MSEQQLPIATVIIATYNYGKYIKSALDSVILQDYPLKRIVIIDDAGTDNTYQDVQSWMDDKKEVKVSDELGLAILGKYKDTSTVLLHNNENKGPSYSRNKGIKVTWPDSHVFAILDADDEWVQGKLSKSVMKILEDPQRIGGVYTDSDNLNQETGIKLREYREPFDLPRLLGGHNMIHSGCVFNKLALQECGLYDESLWVCEDLDLHLRIAQKFAYVHIPQPLVIQRVHSNSLSAGNTEKYQAAWRYISQKYGDKRQ